MAGTRTVEIYRNQPGLGAILGARVLAEFGDDPTRYTDARPGRTTPVCHRSPGPPGQNGSYWPPTPATDDLFLQAQSALRASPGARAYYDQQRARGASHYQALRISRTASSASSTAASATTPSTTNASPGTPRQTKTAAPLDHFGS